VTDIITVRPDGSCDEIHCSAAEVNQHLSFLTHSLPVEIIISRHRWTSDFAYCSQCLYLNIRHFSHVLHLIGLLSCSMADDLS